MTHDMIVRAGAESLRINQTMDISAVQYSEIILRNALHCSWVNNKSCLKIILLKGDKSVYHIL